VRALEAIRIRKQMSMDFHDEMGNKLAGMLAQASLLKLKHKDTELSKTFDFFERNAYAIYHGTKDFIWTIDVKSNNWKEVISYLRDFGFGFFERNQINFHVQNYSLDERFDHQLPDGVNRQVILIFKEAMTNSLKHSACKNVYFSTNMEGDTFKISFADDGAWNIENTRGNGITNMNKRAEKINARLVIERQQGTKVTLFVKK